MRPGGTWSGPARLEIADTAGFLLTIAHLQAGSDALTVATSMQFLHPPPAAAHLTAEARLLRMSGRTSVVTVELRSAAVAQPVARDS